MSKLRSVTMPNGCIIQSTWYKHPWLTASGQLSKAPLDGCHRMPLDTLRRLEAEYLEQLEQRKLIAAE